MSEFSRRELLKSAGIAGAAAAITHVSDAQAAQSQLQPQPGAKPENGATPQQNQGQQQGQQQSATATKDVLFFFNDDEARLVRTAVDRLIPADDKWGGAEAAGVLYYIDRQLASAWGAGAKMYLKGPWQPEAPPEQGYQLRYSPGELYRVAISELRDAVRKEHNGQEFWELSQDDMDKLLKGLESGDLQLQSIPSPVFFETLLANTVEGFFADPAYGGNRDMVAWRMVGFPGPFGQYVGLVDQHGFAYTREPLSIASSFGVLCAPDQKQQ